MKTANVLGYITLIGILIKLCFVFWSLFGQLDGDSFLSKILGITFASASIYFVLQPNRKPLKLFMVALDAVIICYYYLHTLLQLDIQLAAIPIAIYSGIIIYYVGANISVYMVSHDLKMADQKIDMVNQELKLVSQQLEMVNQARQQDALLLEKANITRALKRTTNETTRDKHLARLAEIDLLLTT